MRAITVAPKTPHSARLDEVDEPAADEGSVLVRMLALGVCGTDADPQNATRQEAALREAGVVVAPTNAAAARLAAKVVAA